MLRLFTVPEVQKIVRYTEVFDIKVPLKLRKWYKNGLGLDIRGPPPISSHPPFPITLINIRRND